MTEQDEMGKPIITDTQHIQANEYFKEFVSQLRDGDPEIQQSIMKMMYEQLEDSPNILFEAFAEQIKKIYGL